jgi:hypothetical protein
LLEPNMTKLAAIMKIAMRTKPPIIILFACLAMCADPVA